MRGAGQVEERGGEARGAGMTAETPTLGEIFIDDED